MHLYLFLLGNISGDPDNFLYLNNSGQRNKQEEDFEPKFIDNLNVTDEQRAFCNDNMECIFDLVVTGQEDIAKNSMEFDAETSTVQEDLGIIIIMFMFQSLRTYGCLNAGEA